MFNREGSYQNQAPFGVTVCVLINANNLTTKGTASNIGGGFAIWRGEYIATELITLHKQYNKPRGALLLAYYNKLTIGCAAMRELNTETAELKRMFVQPEYRKHKIGQRLLELIIGIAKEFNYHTIRLDTLPGMTQAQTLYRAFGFYEIPAYRYNPDKGTVYMEKKLNT